MSGAVAFMDKVFIAYFLAHIPISAAMDFQLLAPDAYPTALRDLRTNYVAQFQDTLMDATLAPLWFRTFIACELLFQFPLFFILPYGLYKRTNSILAD
jgi:hypothetical protein